MSDRARSRERDERSRNHRHSDHYRSVSPERDRRRVMNDERGESSQVYAESSRSHRHRDERDRRERRRSTSSDSRNIHHERRRQRSRDRSRDRHHSHRDGRDRRRDHDRRRHSDTESDSSSSSESEDERRRRRRKEARRRKEKEERRRHKERKREKKSKKERKRGTAAVTAQWGKYGIISEADIAAKDSEFRAWLVEERKMNPEVLSKENTRKEFSTFIEDYNTATLPHEKFYDMAKWDVRMNLIRSGGTVPDESAAYDPMADMKAHSSVLKSQATKKEQVITRAELEELRRLEAERVEITKRKQLGLDVPRHLGVRTEEVEGYRFE